MNDSVHASLDTKTGSAGATDPRLAVHRAWSTFCKLARDEQRTDLIDTLEPTMRRFDLGLFRLVVMGEIKKGKSSFLNSLLGEPDLLPTASDVATSTVYKLIYGPTRRFKVFLLPDVDTGEARPPTEIGAQQLDEFGTEQGNPLNKKRVDFIGVELPNALLKEGLVLVDTPGVGGLYKAHREITWRYAPHADAVCFVLDSVEAVISQDEVLFLRELMSKATKRVFFVQTKTDQADTEQWQAWCERNKAVLHEKLGIPADRLYYFPVSSLLKSKADQRCDVHRLAESGFPAVLAFLRSNLMQNKTWELARDVAKQLSVASGPLLQGVREQVRISQQESKVALDDVRREYVDATQFFERWEKTTLIEETRRFSDRFADVRRLTRERLRETLDASGPLVTEAINALRSLDLGAKQVEEKVREIQQATAALAFQRSGEIQRQFNQEVSTLINDTSRAMAAGFEPSASTDVAACTQGEQGVQDVAIVDTLHLRSSAFEDLRSGLYGGLAGSTMAYIAIGGLSLVFPPAAALAWVAPFVGGAIGGWLGAQEHASRKHDEALGKLQNVLRELMMKCQHRAVSQFDEIAVSYERHARDSFQAAAAQSRVNLKQRLHEVEQAASRTKEENQAHAGRLSGKIKEIEGLQSVLQGLVKREVH